MFDQMHGGGIQTGVDFDAGFARNWGVSPETNQDWRQYWLSALSALEATRSSTVDPSIGVYARLLGMEEMFWNS